MGTSFGLNQFAGDMRRISLLFRRNTERAIRGAVVLGATEAAIRTPYRTGRARSNWAVGVGQPELRDDPSPGSEEASTSKPVDQALQAVGAWSLEQELFISNGVPYIQHLDDGSPTTSPSNMTAAAMSRMRAALSQSQLLRGV
jgi:hypothetical protein